MRPATRADFEVVREIERAADQRFREIGLGFVADGEPTSYAVLAESAARGALWVEVDVDDQPVAFASADVLDGRAHLEQLSVLPAYGRRGIGRSLTTAVEDWAHAEGMDVVTLTTFAEVPWNAPYYRRLGYEAVPESEWTPQVRERIRAEMAHFAPHAREVMAKRLG